MASELAALITLGIGMWEHSHERPLPAYLLFIASFLLFWGGAYVAWLTQYKNAEDEKRKNEIAPDFEVAVLTLTTKGEISKGVTDLFVYLRLTLKAPREVAIRDFSLIVRHDTHVLVSALATDDLDQWEVVKDEPSETSLHIPCTPITKSLRQRGDPLEGWIHFHWDGLSESFLLNSALRIKANCALGTCFSEVDGKYAFPDRFTKVRRKLAI